MSAKQKPIWDLSVFYPKMSLKTICDKLKQKIEKFSQHIASEHLVENILQLQELEAELENAYSYADCLYAQNIEDQEAVQFKDSLQALIAAFRTASDGVNHLLASMSDKEFKVLLANPKIKSVQFPLDERRKQSRERLSLQEESIIHALSVNGLHGWYQLYQTHVGKMRIPCVLEGKKQSLSVGQLYNHLTHPDRKTRKHLFSQWVKTWDQEKDILAQILNQIAGFRLQIYEKRNWQSHLKEALEAARMQEKTLHTMWETISKNKAPLVEYIKCKAKLLKIKKLEWHDLTAPLPIAEKEFSYAQGIDFVEKSFNQYSPLMGDLVKQAQKERWIEAENRPGKNPGGFCTPFPLKKQSRVFMTYSNSLENLNTLTHELGHAYHSQAVFDLPALVQAYPMSLAETASTFAEQILSDALLKTTKKSSERLFLLDQRLQRSLVFLMNIHARFLFEDAFYQERQKGVVSADRLFEMMEEAQKKAYCETLSEYHPHFWEGKVHFYLTSIPFYNFPYTFGYLFSLGIYALNPSPESYHKLLQDTGRMTCEELAKHHLNVDLTKPQFWQKALDIVAVDAQLFLEEAKKHLS